MKLTAEQKQLFHECVDLGLELTEHNTCSEVSTFIDIGEGHSYGVEQCFKLQDLQQAKDYLTKIETIYQNYWRSDYEFRQDERVG